MSGSLFLGVELDHRQIYSEEVGKGHKDLSIISGPPEAILSRIFCQVPVLAAELEHKSGLA